MAPFQVSERLAQRTAQRQQAATVNQQAALPPLLPFSLTPDEHCQQAVARLCVPVPTEQAPMLDLDLSFAAECTARSRGLLREVRQCCMSLTLHLRQFQTDALRAVTATRNIGFTALLCVWLCCGQTRHFLSG